MSGEIAVVVASVDETLKRVDERKAQASQTGDTSGAREGEPEMAS